MMDNKSWTGFFFIQSDEARQKQKTSLARPLSSVISLAYSVYIQHLGKELPKNNSVNSHTCNFKWQDIYFCLTYAFHIWAYLVFKISDYTVQAAWSLSHIIYYYFFL